MPTGRPALTAAISLGTQLWMQWAWIALDHRDEAWEARERDGGPPVSNAELQASMVAITAAASAIDGFATDVRDLGAPPRLTAGTSPPPRAVVIWETLRANFDVGHKTQSWPASLKGLWQVRSNKPGGGIVHPRTEVGEPVPLPGYAPAPARLRYTAESATTAAQLMVEITESCNSAALLPGHNDDLRARVDGYVSYVAEYVRRA